MKYTSTRDRNVNINASEAIIKGISEDGGLFVPVEIPKLESLDNLIGSNYNELAYEIMKLYFTDLPSDALKKTIDNAYDGKFTGDDIAPLKKIGEDYFLELYHGPTFAFKDMALSILPHLLKESIKVQNIDKEVVILTATSGDTGKAALEGFANVAGTNIIVFYPADGVSRIQELQMATQKGNNTFVIGINGNFDDAQTGVKMIFNDKKLREKLLENNFIFSSANSINIGRLIPQIVYYFYSYLKLLKFNEIKKDEKINISVPTGNFGNILAAFYAKEMGLPINKLICASNENNILTDFFNTNVYDKRRDLELTSSPSMDILVSSNLERLLYHLNKDEDSIKKAMEKLDSDGLYELKDINISDFYANYAREEEVTAEIKRIYKRYNYLIDTHTAVASKVYTKYRYEYKDFRKSIVVSTASPFKFSKAVASSIELDTANKDEFTILDNLSQETNLELPMQIKSLKDKEIVHDIFIEKDNMKKTILELLGLGVGND